MQDLLDALYDEKDDEASFLRRVKKNWELRNGKKVQSFGEYCTELFNLYNAEFPIHERKSIQAASLDWIERNVVRYYR
jgi:hypothetical protein